MKIFRRTFNLATILGTVVVFAVMFLLQTITSSSGALYTLEQAISDFRISDVYFSKIRDNEAIEADTNIVIVNTGMLPSDGIAAQIEIISRYQPKVIGVDVLFPEPSLKLEQQSSIVKSLMDASQRVPIVVGSKLHKHNVVEEKFDSLSFPFTSFHDFFQTGFADIIIGGSGKYQTARKFSYKQKVKDSTEYSFATKIMQIAYPQKVQNLLQRDNEEELINYRGNWQKFTALDPFDVLEENFDPSLFKDKIVLLGFMGNHFYEDIGKDGRYYTPLNERSAGRAATDMYGIMIHANVLSMIFHQNYFNVTPTYLSIILALLLCFLNVVVFSQIYLNKKLGMWYGIITKIVQLVEMVFFVFIILLMLSKFNYILEITVGILAVVLSADVLELFLGFLVNLYPKAVKMFRIK